MSSLSLKFLALFGKTIMGLMLLLGVSIGVVVVFFQSQDGRDLLTTQLERMSHTHSKVTLETLNGTFPWDLNLKRLTLHDTKGVWLEMENIRFSWSWRALLQGRLHIHEASARRMRLYKHPNKRSKTTRHTVSNSNKPIQWPRKLPPFLLDRLSVQTLILESPIVGKKERFTLMGTLKSDESFSHLKLRMHLRALDKRDLAITLNGTMTGSPLTLMLNVKGMEMGALTSRLLRLPQAKGLTFHLKGEGSLADWKGALNGTLIGVGSLQSQIQLSLSHFTTLKLNGTIAPDLNLFKPDVAQLLGNSLGIGLQGSMVNPGELQINRMDLTSAFASLKGSGSLNLKKQTLNLKTNLKIPTLKQAEPLFGKTLAGDATAVIHLQGTIHKPHINMLLNVKKGRLADIKANVLTIKLDGDPFGPTKKPFESIHIVGTGEVDNLSKADGTPLLEETLHLNIDMMAPLKGLLQLKKLNLKGDHLTLNLTGQFDPQQKQGKGYFGLKFKDLDVFHPFIQPSLAHLEGRGNITGSYHIKKALESFKLKLKGDIKAIKGLPLVAQTLIGSSIQLSTQIKLKPGHLINMTDMNIQGEGIQLSGEITNHLDHDILTGLITTQIADLKPLGKPFKKTLSGSLHIQTHLMGSLNNPQMDIKATSDHLQIDQKQLVDVVLQSKINTLQPHKLLGNLKLDLFQSNQPLSLQFDYGLLDSNLDLNHIILKLPDNQLTGSLRTHLINGRVDGTLKGDLKDLEKLTSWHGQQLKGRVTFTSQWTSQSNNQGVVADLNGHLLRGDFGLMEKAHLHLDIDDLFNQPQGEATLSLLRFNQGDINLRQLDLHIKGSTPSAILKLNLSGQAKKTFNLQANGQLGWKNQTAELSLNNLSGHIGQDPLQLQQKVTLSYVPNGPLHLTGLELRYGPAHLTTEGHYDTQTLRAHLNVQIPLALSGRLGGPDMEGKATIQATVTGTPSSPKAWVEVLMDDAIIKDPTLETLPPAKLFADARLEEGQLSAHFSLEKWTSPPITAQLRLPAIFSLSPFEFQLPETIPWMGSLSAKGELSPFSFLAGLDEQKIGGLLKIALFFGGTLQSPEVHGGLTVENGSYSNTLTGTTIRELNMNMEAKGKTMVIQKLEATDDYKGRLNGKGHLKLDFDQHFPFDWQITLDKGEMVRRDDLTATLSGTLGLKGNKKQVTLSSNLNTDHLIYYLSEKGGPDVERILIDEVRYGGIVSSHKPTPQKTFPLNLDLSLHMPNRVFVRGRGLESEWQGDIKVSGTQNKPTVNGQLSIKNGYFEFFDRRFDLRKGAILFDGASPPQPHLDIETSSKGNNMTAVLSLNGLVTNPQLTLASEPEYPQDEILSRLLFDRDSQQLTPSQAISLASAVETLRSGGRGMLGAARDTIGFDKLELGGDSLETGSVKVGKYLSDTVFLEVERGLSPGSGKVSVELEMTPNITVETEVDENNNSGLGVNWKYDY